ncbi:hypothetical protein ACHHYP_10230 [Achlya hypogyna]|uniref:EF-hand domain-containing protein n=1 Tax=Achlya hypogyna TaxID=1202772 RepID=A0A1V9YM00_ACHHY|nr:hypothetical protein ACHHYP_10230 [Achlya hypogyna]
MEQELDVDDWFYRIADVYSYSREKLLDRFYRGKYKKGVRHRQLLPLEYVYHGEAVTSDVLNDLEPSSTDPLTPSMQVMQVFCGYLGRIKECADLAVAKAHDYGDRIDDSRALQKRMPLKYTVGLPLNVEEPLLADIAHTLGRYKLLDATKDSYVPVERLQGTLQAMVHFNIAPEAFYDLCVGFPMKDPKHVDARAVLDAMHDHLRYQLRPAVTEVHALAEPKRGRSCLLELQEALQTHHVSFATLYQQCSLFDFEDDGLITTAGLLSSSFLDCELSLECLSILQSFPCHTQSAAELEKVLQPYTQAPKTISYTNLARIALRSDVAFEQRVYVKLRTIFDKLSADHITISTSDLDRVLGNHWSPKELDWACFELQQGRTGKLGLHQFYLAVFPNAHKEHSITNTKAPHDTILGHVRLARSEIKAAFEQFATPYSGYLTPRQALSAIESLTSPVVWTQGELDDIILTLDKAQNGQIGLSRLLDLFTQQGPSTFGTASRFEKGQVAAVGPYPSSPKKPLVSETPLQKSPEAPHPGPLAYVVELLAERCNDVPGSDMADTIPLHMLLRDADEGVGGLSARHMSEVLWPVADQFTTIKFQALGAMLAILESTDGTVKSAEVADLIFDWPGLQLHLQSIASYSEVLELFQARDPDHRGCLRLVPDFHLAFFKIFHTELQDWELDVMFERFGVSIGGEAWIDYRALVAFLLPRTANDLFDDLVDLCVPGISQGDQEVYRSFKRFDKDEKGYFDRKDLRRVLQQELNIEATQDQEHTI